MKQSRLFELEYKELIDLFYDESWSVESPGYLVDQITGQRREVDVLITKTTEGIMRRIGIECRDRSRFQGIGWIEEFYTKKNDIGLDLLILASSSGFTDTAIIKAKHYGIILESAERVNKDLVKNVSDIAYIDNHFLYMVVKRLDFVINSVRVTLKELLDMHDIATQARILNEINQELYLDTCCKVDEVRKNCNLDETKIFIENPIPLHFNFSTAINENVSKLFSKLQIQFMVLDVEVRSVTSSMPLTQSLATFDTEKENKRYHGKYTSSSDEIQIAYSEENVNIIVEFNYDKREYLRLVGGPAQINTIVPEGKKIQIKNMNNIINNVVGKFDLTEVL